MYMPLSLYPQVRSIEYDSSSTSPVTSWSKKLSFVLLVLQAVQPSRTSAIQIRLIHDLLDRIRFAQPRAEPSQPRRRTGAWAQLAEASRGCQRAGGAHHGAQAGGGRVWNVTCVPCARLVPRVMPSSPTWPSATCGLEPSASAVSVNGWM